MSEETVEVFKAAIKHAESIAPLFDAYRVFYGKSSDIPLAEAFLRERLSNDECVIFICRMLSSPVPTGFAQLYPLFSSVCARRIWLLNDLFVSSDFRRLGVARRLLQAVHEHARETGAIEVVLSTAHTNASAQALYQSFGYVRDTEFRTYRFAPCPNEQVLSTSAS